MCASQLPGAAKAKSCTRSTAAWLQRTLKRGTCMVHTCLAKNIIKWQQCCARSSVVKTKKRHYANRKLRFQKVTSGPWDAVYQKIALTGLAECRCHTNYNFLFCFGKRKYNAGIWLTQYIKQYLSIWVTVHCRRMIISLATKNQQKTDRKNERKWTK